MNRSIHTVVFLCDLVKDAFSTRYEAGFSPALGWGALEEVFPCRSSGLHPAVPSVLRGVQLKVSLQPCCRGEFGT